MLKNKIMENYIISKVPKSLITEARQGPVRIQKKEKVAEKPKKIDDKIVIDLFTNKANKK